MASTYRCDWGGCSRAITLKKRGEELPEGWAHFESKLDVFVCPGGTTLCPEHAEKKTTDDALCLTAREAKYWREGPAWMGVAECECGFRYVLHWDACPACGKPGYDLRVHDPDGIHGWGFEFQSRSRTVAGAFRQFIMDWLERSDVSGPYKPFLQSNDRNYLFIECWSGPGKKTLTELIAKLRANFEASLSTCKGCGELFSMSAHIAGDMVCPRCLFGG